MMKTRLFNRGPLAAAAIAFLAAAGLSACSPDPYPTPVAEEPPPPPPVELAGGYEPPPPPPPPPEPSYSSAPVVIAMAPIPNPPETPRRARRARTSSAAPRQAAPRYVAPPAPRAVAPAARTATAPARPNIVAKGPTPLTPPAKVAPAAKPAAPNAKVPATPKVAAAPNAAPQAGAPKTAAPNTAAPAGDRAARLESLRSALADAAGKGAKLTVPGSFAAGTPADVTLAFPADFADTVKAEAEKNQLANEARSVNLTAALSGDGFVVTPDETQSLPLVAGQPTEFKWSVTAQPNARASTLKADVGADLLGGGMDTLNLGSISAGDTLFGFKVNPRWVGGAVIVALLVLIISWLTRGRSGPTRSASARRAARRAVRNDRPFDLDREPA
jgi:hypothetical protein